MVATGRVRDRRIDLDEPLDLPNGTRVEVLVRPLSTADSSSIIGLFADDAELLDEIIQQIMVEREMRPLRLNSVSDE